MLISYIYHSIKCSILCGPAPDKEDPRICRPSSLPRLAMRVGLRQLHLYGNVLPSHSFYLNSTISKPPYTFLTSTHLVASLERTVSPLFRTQVWQPGTADGEKCPLRMRCDCRMFRNTVGILEANPSGGRPPRAFQAC